MALKDNLISYFKLEEASGTRDDAHGSNDLTDNNTVTQTTGKVGNAALFTAANSESLSITDAAQSGLDFTGDYSFSYWINLNSDPDSVIQDTITKWNDTVQFSYIHEITATGYKVFHRNGATQEAAEVTQTFATSTDYHIAVVYDSTAGTFELFVNNSSIGTSAAITNSQDSTAIFALGARNLDAGGLRFLDGWMDEVAIWNRKITSGEISEIYNSGTGLGYDDWDVAGGTSKNLLLLGVG